VSSASFRSESRREIRLVAPSTEAAAVEDMLHRHPACFTSLYPPRRVNDLYFERPGDVAVVARLPGTVRTSLRLRWYGEERRDVFGAVELKVESVNLTCKVSQANAELLDLSTCSAADVHEAISRSTRGFVRLELERRTRGSLVVSSLREYLASADGDLLVTVDHDIRVGAIAPGQVVGERLDIDPSDKIMVELHACQDAGDRLFEAAGALPLVRSIDHPEAHDRRRSSR